LCERQIAKVKSEGGVEAFPSCQRSRFVQIDAVLAEKLSSLLFVVGAIMRPVEVGSQTKVAELDMPI
jgi:hypothetical protein